MHTVLISATNILLQQQNIIGKNKPTLSISRELHHDLMASKTVPLSYTEQPTPPLDSYHRLEVQGTVGIIWLLGGPYLILISESKPICRLPEPLHTPKTRCRCRDTNVQPNKVYCINDVILLPIIASSLQPMLTRPLAKEENQLVSMVRNLLVPSKDNPERFYYSSGLYDITRTYQKQKCYRKKKNTWKRPKTMFWWNSHLVSDFKQDSKCFQWVVPIINGFVGTTGSCKVQYAPDDENVEMLLIARRSKFHQGCRFTARGLNVDGHAANEVECEQIVMPTMLRRGVRSYVQIRGSLPVRWSQKPTMLDVPRIRALEESKSSDLFNIHMNRLESRYGDVSCVNLVSGKEGWDSNVKKQNKIKHIQSKKGDQEFLGQLFEKSYHERCEKKRKTQGKSIRKNSSSSKFVWFDFHRNCRGRKYNNLSKLSCIIRPILKNYGYYQSNGRTSLKKQKGVIRTNCMDTLDRTNAVQTLFSGIMLLELLDIDVSLHEKYIPLKLSLSNTSENGLFLLLGNEMNKQLRELWVACGDRMSYCYAHSPSQKKQVIRNGVYTNIDQLSDFKTSMIRYIHNNFTQGRRQDALDLFLGVYKPSSSFATLHVYQSNLKKQRIQTLVCLGSVLMLLTCLLLKIFAKHYCISWMCWLLTVVSIWFFSICGCFYAVLKRGWMKKWTNTIIERPHFSDQNSFNKKN